MLFLTGALDSLSKTQNNPQTDSQKSLGGFVSSTPVPSGEINSLFGLISQHTLAEHPRETIALGLINNLEYPVKDVELRIVVNKESVALYKVAAVALNDKFAMEHINNRNAEPMDAQFYDATFQRAAVDIKITNPASKGEEIALIPFDVQIQVEQDGIEGTWQAFENAFLMNETYDIKRISTDVFRIIQRDETVVEDFGELSYVSTGGFRMDYQGEFKNDKTGFVTLFEGEDQLAPEQGIGIWLQRIIKPNQFDSNEQILEDFKNGKIKETVEEFDVIISYNIVETIPTTDENS